MSPCVITTYALPAPTPTHTHTHTIANMCPTRNRTRHFFNNFTTNEDIATKFEADLPHCVKNVMTS